MIQTHFLSSYQADIATSLISEIKLIILEEINDIYMGNIFKLSAGRLDAVIGSKMVLENYFRKSYWESHSYVRCLV